MSADSVTLDTIIITSSEHNAIANRGVLKHFGRRIKIVIILHQVVDNRISILRWIRFRIKRVGIYSGHVISPDRITYDKVASSIRTRKAQRVIFRNHIRDEGITWMAGPNIESGIRMSRCQGVVELSVGSVIRIDPIVSIVISCQITVSPAFICNTAGAKTLSIAETVGPDVEGLEPPQAESMMLTRKIMGIRPNNENSVLFLIWERWSTSVFR